ncbi:MAG: helix-turn-helix domain-containing protein [Phycisphaerales bacterium]
MTDRTRIVARSTNLSALGGVTQSGLIAASRGIPFDNLRVLGQYALVYLLDGAGRYIDARGTDRPVNPGDLILVFPDLAHAYGPAPDQHWREFYLVFRGPLFDLWRSTNLLNEHQPILHLEPIDHWLARFESVLSGSRQPGWSPPLLEVTRLQQVLAEVLVGGSKSAIPNDDLRWASRACALLEADLSPSVDLHRVAGQLKINYESFRRRFTRIVGLPPARYRASRLIDRACELMQTSDMTDKQIAYSLGFCDEFHFSRRFKQILGSSPRNYRATLPRTS